MEMPQPKDFRASPRYILETNPGTLRLASSRKEVNYEGLNYSRDGLGILCHTQVLPDTELILETPNGSAELEIVWCMPDYKGTGTFRYGLKTKGASCNLEELVQGSHAEKKRQAATD